MNICKLATLAGLDHFGTYDYSVPFDWLMQNPEKNRPHYWWYSKKPGSLFGRPLKWAAVARMALWKMRRELSPDLMDFLNAWSVAHPEKQLDRFGRKLIARFIEAEDCREPWQVHSMLMNLRLCFKGAGVPLPDFLEETPDTSGFRKAA